MKVGDLIKHITQDKWGIILETVDYTEHIHRGVYCNILWSDEEIPWWIWNDMVKVVKNANR